MSGLLWSALGQGIAQAGNEVANSMSRAALEEERYREKLELQRERLQSRDEQQRRDLEFKREMAAQRQQSTGGGGRREMTDVEQAAAAGMTLPEYRKVWGYVEQGKQALAEPVTTLDDEQGVMTSSAVPAGAERWAQSKAAALSKIRQESLLGKDLKDVAQGRETLFQLDQAQRVLSGEAKASDVGSAIAASQGKDRYTTASGVVLDKFSGEARNLERAPAAEKEKAPPGYRFQADGSLAAIPGGPAAEKRSDAQNADRIQTDAAISSMGKLAKAAKDLLQHPGVDRITGLSGVVGNIPGQAGAGAEAKLEHLKSQVAFGTLAEMRAASKTGGALGAVSNKELGLLESNLAGLSTKQSPEQFRQALEAIIQHATEAGSRMESGFEQKWGGAAPSPSPAPATTADASIPTVNSPADLARLPAGATFRAPDGSIRRKMN